MSCESTPILPSEGLTDSSGSTEHNDKAQENFHSVVYKFTSIQLWPVQLLQELKIEIDSLAQHHYNPFSPLLQLCTSVLFMIDAVEYHKRIMSLCCYCYRESSVNCSMSHSLLLGLLQIQTVKMTSRRVLIASQQQHMLRYIVRVFCCVYIYSYACAVKAFCGCTHLFIPA